MPDEESLSREVEEADKAIINGMDGATLLALGTAGVRRLRANVNALVAAVRKQERAQARSYKESLADMVWQFAYRTGDGPGEEARPMFTGGLSSLEWALDVLGIPDPCPVEEFNRVLAAPVEGGEG